MNLFDSKTTLLTLALMAQSRPTRRSHGETDFGEMRRYKPEDRASKKRQRNARKQRYK